MGYTEKGLRGGLCISKIVSQIGIKFALGSGTIEHFLYSRDDLIVHTHIEINTREETKGGIVARIARIATRFTHILRCQLKVSHNLLIHFAYRLASGGRSGACHKRHPHIVGTLTIWFGIECNHVQVHQRTHIVCLAEELFIRQVLFLKGLNNRIRHIDNLVCQHPKCTYILKVVGHHICCRFVERVFCLTTKTDIVCGELSQLGIMTHIRITAGIADILHLILEHSIATIHNILCTCFILKQRIRV